MTKAKQSGVRPLSQAWPSRPPPPALLAAASLDGATGGKKGKMPLVEYSVHHQRSAHTLMTRAPAGVGV